MKQQIVRANASQCCQLACSSLWGPVNRRQECAHLAPASRPPLTTKEMERASPFRRRRSEGGRLAHAQATSAAAASRASKAAAARLEGMVH